MTDNIKHTIQLFSHCYSVGCEVCGENVRENMNEEDLSVPINHYIQKHGYKLLHVGPYTSEGDEGPWQGTTAILGSEVVPPVKEHKELDEFGL